jgi:hypothetical protein
MLYHYFLPSRVNVRGFSGVFLGLVILSTSCQLKPGKSALEGTGASSVIPPENAKLDIPPESAACKVNPQDNKNADAAITSVPIAFSIPFKKPTEAEVSQDAKGPVSRFKNFLSVIPFIKNSKWVETLPERLGLAQIVVSFNLRMNTSFSYWKEAMSDCEQAPDNGIPGEANPLKCKLALTLPEQEINIVFLTEAEYSGEKGFLKKLDTLELAKNVKQIEGSSGTYFPSANIVNSVVRAATEGNQAPYLKLATTPTLLSAPSRSLCEIKVDTLRLSGNKVDCRNYVPGSGGATNMAEQGISALLGTLLWGLASPTTQIAWIPVVGPWLRSGVDSVRNGIAGLAQKAMHSGDPAAPQGADEFIAGFVQSQLQNILGCSSSKLAPFPDQAD